jgi:hypothetical protein
VAVGKSRRQIEAIVKEDPFYEHDLADPRWTPENRPLIDTSKPAIN